MSRRLPTSPTATSQRVRRTMQAIRSRDTLPEVNIRSLVHAGGLRFRIHRRVDKAVPGRVDLLFARARVAVFIDGCFWHGCPAHGKTPNVHREYWVPKLQRNRERDE